MSLEQKLNSSPDELVLTLQEAEMIVYLTGIKITWLQGQLNALAGRKKTHPQQADFKEELFQLETLRNEVIPKIRQLK